MIRKLINLVLFATLVLMFTSCEVIWHRNLTLEGELTGYSECKFQKSADFPAETPDSLSCITYSFDKSLNKLSITHINAGFNCCPDELYSEVSLAGDTILIEEYEELDMPCDCNCLYDLEIEITGISEKEYTLLFIEPYRNDQEILEFSVDLKNNPEGSFCVTRKQYPWGVLL